MINSTYAVAMKYLMILTLLCSLFSMARADEEETSGVRVSGILNDGKTPVILTVELNPEGETASALLRITPQASNSIPSSVSFGPEGILQLADSLDRTEGYVERITGESTAAMLNNKFSAETTDWGEENAPPFRAYFAKEARTASYRTYYQLGGESQAGVILTGTQPLALQKQLRQSLAETAAVRQLGLVNTFDDQLAELANEQKNLAARLVALQAEEEALANKRVATIEARTEFGKRVEAANKKLVEKTRDLAERLVVR